MALDSDGSGYFNGAEFQRALSNLGTYGYVHLI